MNFNDLNIIYEVVAGSHSYGLNDENSDLDIRGVALPPIEYILGMNRFEQYEDRESDTVYYSLSKFIKLAADGNPNILELLFVDNEFVKKMFVPMDSVLLSRDHFLSKKAAQKFFSYGYSQVKRMETHWRWLNSPPAKPDPFDYGAEKNDDGNTFWPKGSQKAKYDDVKRDFSNYENWRKNRNEKRAKLEEQHGYDTKFAMHAIRLGIMAENLLKNSEIRPRLPIKQRSFLRDIKSGHYSYKEICEYVEELKSNFDSLMEKSLLAETANYSEINKILVQCMKDYLYDTR